MTATRRCMDTDFNPHSRKGSDQNTSESLSISHLISIHTPARGVTNVSVDTIMYLCISIHTPARGVTDPIKYNGEDGDISIHTPARGVTLTE